MTKKLTLKITVFIVVFSFLIGNIFILDSNAGVNLKGENITVTTTSGETFTVRSLLVTDGLERYICLSDMSVVLKNSSKPFTVTWSGSDVSIERGSSTERSSTGSYSSEDVAITRNQNTSSGTIKVNGNETSYSCVIDDLGGSRECFMKMADFAMMADVYIYFEDTWHVDADKGFYVEIDSLVNSGYFEGIDAALIGDATTGEIYFDNKGDEVLEIASTTKLITYSVIMDAISSGQIHTTDLVTISDNVSKLAKGEDGVIGYEPGDQIPVSELIIAILLPSSNESALAMAEYISGSEEAFVEKMNEKLESIGVYDATIFNCHGLPVYVDGGIPAKNQNRLSAEDMFKVVCHIMEYYPEITQITSMKNAELPTIGTLVKNTNGVLKNLSSANGLKTGTTTKSGACLVASGTATNDAGEEHTLIAIVYGAENNVARIGYGELLLRLAMQEFREGPSTIGSSGVVSAGKTTDPKKLLNQIMKNARNKGLIQ